MQSSDSANRYALPASIVLAGLALFLFAAHYVKAYSDPYWWLTRAQDFAAGNLATRWAPIFPMFLAAALRIVGPVGVFLVNLPLLVLLAWLVRRITIQCSGSRVDAGLAGLFALALLVFVNRPLLLELQNPYREALAFCLLLGGVSLLFSFASERRLWQAAGSACLIGLSIGVRETCILVLPVAAAWLAALWIRKRGAKAAGWLALFACVLALALLPFFIQNYLQSGQLWIPSYAARKWLWMSSGQAARWDIPIPGMSLHNFPETGRKMLAFLAAKYSWWGAGLLLAGLFFAWRRRLTAVSGFLLPVILINLLFYAFWHRMDWRFTFIVDLFIAPILAIGAAALLGFAKPRLRDGAAWLFVALALAGLAQSWKVQPPRLKVWHIPALRRFAAANLEQPASFLASPHLTQMLNWLLQAPPCAVPTGVEEDRVRDRGMDEALRAAAAPALAAAAGGGTYWCGESPPPLLRQWFHLEPSVSLGDAPVPIDHYGERVTDRVFRIRPWQSNVIERILERSAPRADYLLMVDCFRLWDYPGRTWCRLATGDGVLEQTVSNGVHFVFVPGSASPERELRVRVESDGPLPPDPVLKLIPLNSELRLEFGLATEAWYWPYLSSSLMDVEPTKDDSFLLYDRGAVLLPRFATANQEVFAEWKVEYVDPGRQSPPCLALESVAGSACVRLPRQGLSTRLTASLGPGTGALAWTKVDLSVLSACDSTNVPPRSGNRGRFIKVYRARLYPFSWDPRDSVQLDVGGAEDDPFLLDGFFGLEKHEGRTTVRWTAPQCRVRLPVSRAYRALAFTVRHVPVRPAAHPPNPRFVVAGWSVPTDRVEALTQDDGTQDFYFEVPTSRFVGSGPVVLEIQTDPWTPADTGGGADHRKLGLMLDAVEVAPAAFE